MPCFAWSGKNTICLRLLAACLFQVAVGPTIGIRSAPAGENTQTFVDVFLSKSSQHIRFLSDIYISYHSKPNVNLVREASPPVPTHAHKFLQFNRWHSFLWHWTASDHASPWGQKPRERGIGCEIHTQGCRPSPVIKIPIALCIWAKPLAPALSQFTSGNYILSNKTSAVLTRWVRCALLFHFRSYWVESPYS